MLYGSKDGSNEDIFECHNYYGDLFHIVWLEEETVEEISRSYEVYTENYAVLDANLLDIKNQIFHS